MGGEDFSYRATNFSHQDWLSLDQSTQSNATELYVCNIIDVMNDETRLRLEFIVPNGHHKLTFESWVGRISFI
eukprot:scaffold165216_cov89-Cyclotella_meneghiniana.AAC.1